MEHLPGKSYRLFLLFVGFSGLTICHFGPKLLGPKLLVKDSNFRRCFATIGFFGYEQPNPPPAGLPQDFLTFYFSDNEQHAELALTRGFDFAVVDSSPSLSLSLSSETLGTERANWSPTQKLSSGLMCRGKFAPHLYYVEVVRAGCTQLWFFDANVQQVDTAYFEQHFFGAADTSKALYVDVAYYALPHNIVTELHHSVTQERWAGYVSGMQAAASEYFHQLELQHGEAALSHCEVASAKYIGFNLLHPESHVISEWLVEQCKINYQGNIILSFLACMRGDVVQSLRALNKTSIVALRQHGACDSRVC